MSVDVAMGRDEANGGNRPLNATPVKNRCLVVSPPKPNELRKTILVLGVERGGTSMVAGVLRALGVDLGKKVGLNHEDPRFITTDLDRLKRVIAVRNQESEVWGFKMPQVAPMLGDLEAIMRNPYYLIVYRNLASIADSWHQRGTGDYLGVIERALHFNQLIVNHLRKSKRPALIVNYERAVVSKRETVEDIVRFLKLPTNEETINRAVGLMSGDGTGYLNLPEHFFAVEAASPVIEQPLLPMVDNSREIVGSDGWIDFPNLKTILVSRPADGTKLPRKFWLKLSFDAPRDVDLKSLPLRIYFDFIGEMFPAHCTRPEIVRGENYFAVETSGAASAIGFGPLQPKTRLKLSPTLFQALPQNG